jgi:PPOX class probable F420-dependent enzyme
MNPSAVVPAESVLNGAARTALARGRLAHLVTLNADGSPQVSCVHVTVEGDEIVCGHLGDYRKVRNVRRDPRVALSVEAEGASGPGFLNYLTIEGTATVVIGGAPALLRRITSEYFGPDGTFPPPGAPEGYVMRIRPVRVYGVGPWADS